MANRILLVFALSVCGPASAGDSDIWIPPPARYDHKASVPLNISRDISPCPKPFGINVVACTGLHQGVGYIMIAPHLSGENYRLALRHEIAHINGWPADHPR